MCVTSPTCTNGGLSCHTKSDIEPRSSEPYDPYIPSGSASGGAGGAGPSSGAAGNNPQNKKIADIQAQIDSTVDIMHQNITKVAERGERLDALQDKTDNLAVSAQGFRRGASRVRKQMWWKDMKMRIIIGVGIVILIVIIVVPIVNAYVSPGDRRPGLHADNIPVSRTSNEGGLIRSSSDDGLTRASSRTPFSFVFVSSPPTTPDT
ncbi:hypothetical protein VHUM_02188 [Vanrija humicola]|uniref:V-SNARE coiled-coil homology domain-containing protein n=1 Tax=Vanrija humicola TaxID=5417 RepID=A0A7D8Z679_VANHU|nr:hypothetical protein VHUM_02188 [Vanrija humicola]